MGRFVEPILILIFSARALSRPWEPLYSDWFDPVGDSPPEPPMRSAIPVSNPVCGLAPAQLGRRGSLDNNEIDQHDAEQGRNDQNKRRIR